ncbi:MAG TPA: phosphate-starvation-inducible PsiE family protein [Povalibacter sp.]|nr:phosphate-starvation-inducible PsiE family protein [Povalibacter sp.]
MIGSSGPLTDLTVRFERIVIVLLQVLLLIVLTIAIAEMFYLIYQAIEHRITSGTGPTNVDSVPELQRALQRAFAGILLIILGLELLDTLRTYFTEHRLRLEIILIVATIAIGRHIIVLDFEHMTGMTMLGIGALTIAVTAGYYLVKRAGDSRIAADATPDA